METVEACSKFYLCKLTLPPPPISPFKFQHVPLRTRLGLIRL